jgi:hypothetical protein
MQPQNDFFMMVANRVDALAIAANIDLVAIPIDPTLCFFPLIVLTVLTQTIWIHSTADIGRSSIVTATQIANYIADSLDVLLFRISGHPLVKSAVGARLCHCQSPTASAQPLAVVYPRANEQE